MKVILFNDEAQKFGVSTEEIRCSFEDELAKGKILGIIASNKAEAVCFEPHEIEALIAELSSGRISLPYLAERLNLNVYYVHLIIKHLLREGRISGDLTYNTFTAKKTLEKSLFEKAKAQKSDHRRKMMHKGQDKIR